MSKLNEEIVAEVQARSACLTNIPKVRMVAISLGYTLVELDTDTLGVCFTPRSGADSCVHYQSAGTLAQKPVLELAELMLSPNPLEKSVGIAAVNAVSKVIMDHEPEKFSFSGSDFLDLLPLKKERLKVGMVGNIGPFLPFLKKHAASLIIVDDNPSLPQGIMGQGPAMSRNIKDLAQVDVLIITGSSAAVGDFDEALTAARSARFIGVVGPSAGWLPDPAFRQGVHAVAGTRITNLPGARRAILEGGGTPHFIRYGQKYTLIPTEKL